MFSLVSKVADARNRELLRDILYLSTPLILENVFQVTMGLADNFFISKLGSEYISGVGVTNLVVNIYMSVFFAIAISSTAFISRHVGAGDKDSASVIAQNSFFLSLMVGVLIGLINIFFYKDILSFLGLNQSLMDATLPYFIVVVGPIVLLSLSTMLSSAFRAVKDTKTTMKIAIASNVINVILNPILIFGVAGMPGLGILGAGIATSFSRLVQVILLLIALKKIRNQVNIKISRTFEVNFKTISKIVRLGVPVAGERLFMRIGQVIYSTFIIGLGTDVYAAYVITGTLDSFAFIPGMSIGGAAATLVGNSIGAKNQEEAFRYAVGSLLVGIFFMTMIGLINFIFAPFIGLLFSKDQSVIGNIIFILRFMLFMKPVSAISLIITPVLQVAGDTRLPMILTTVGIWTFRVLGIYLFVEVLDFGLVAVLTMIFLDLIMRSVFLLVRFHRRKWLRIKIN